MKHLLFLEIPRDEIEQCDTDRIAILIGKMSVGEMRSSVRFWVSGYDEDPRELGEIPDVREYFQQLYKRVPALFYWVDLRSQTVDLLAMALLPIRRTADSITMDATAVTSFLERGLKQAVRFCRERRCPATEIKMAIRSLIDSLRGRPVKTGMESGKIPRPRRRGRPI